MANELDYQLLDRLMDRVKTKVFLGKNAAFLGSIQAGLEFSWVEDIRTASTNGVKLWWNPHWFLSLPEDTRVSILVHELWHPARLDPLRRGNRDHEIWNYACDIWINNTMIREGYSFKGFKPWFNFDYEGWVTEDIYDDLIKRHADQMDEDFNELDYEDDEDDDLPTYEPPPGIYDDIDAPTVVPFFQDNSQEEEQRPKKYRSRLPWKNKWLVDQDGNYDEGDLVEPSETDIDQQLAHTMISNVVRAGHATIMAGGVCPGDVEIALKRFLNPKLPWEHLLRNFFHELGELDYSMARPNRRYLAHDLYLASLMEDEGALDHVMCFQDVSGSICDGDSIRFNSEFKYIKDYFRPKKITAVQFDTIIQQVDVFQQDDAFDEVIIKGRGGTSLVCVRNYILEHRPTAVVIFSDMQVEPMEPLPAGVNIPIIWIALNASDAQVKTGQLVHLRE